jgi:hypothetical protein
MNGLAKNVDLSFLVGRELIQIAIGIHQVIFSFDEQVTISIEGEFSLKTNEGLTTWTPGAPRAACPAIDLLGTSIDSVDAREDGTLQLFLSDGSRLTILDANKEFESYQICRPGMTIVV